MMKAVEDALKESCEFRSIVERTCKIGADDTDTEELTMDDIWEDVPVHLKNVKVHTTTAYFIDGSDLEKFGSALDWLND